MPDPLANVARGAGRALGSFGWVAGLATTCLVFGSGVGHAQSSTCATDAGGVTQCSATPRYQADSIGILREGTTQQDTLKVPALRGEDDTENVGSSFRNLTPQPRTDRPALGCRTDATGVTRC